MARKNKLLLVLISLTAIVGSCMLLVAPDGILDTRPFYTQQEAMNWIMGLEAHEASSYLLFESLDLVYIFLYSTIGFLILGKWALIPGALDLIENAPIILSLKYGSNLPEHLGYISCMKWIAGLIMVVCGVLKFWQLRAKRKN